MTFEPGCRNNWHIHHAKSGGGQILVCAAGRGFYQEEGKEAVEMKPGYGKSGCFPKYEGTKSVLTRTELLFQQADDPE